MAKCETGTQLLARLGARPSLENLEPSLLGSGPKCEEVYEFYGGEGTGKTEVLLHLITKCILPKTWKHLELNGKDTGVVVIDTEICFPVLRLAVVMEHRIKASKSLDVHKEVNTPERCRNEDTYISMTDEEVETFIQMCLKKLHIYQCGSSFQMLTTLHSLETLLANNPNVSLLILDTVSAYYWIDKNKMIDSPNAQDTAMKPSIDILQNYASNYNMVVIAAKSALFHKRAGKALQDKGDYASPMPEQGFFPQASDNTSEHVEFMGKSWSKFVTQRLVFTKSVNQTFLVHYQDNEGLQTLAQFKVAESGVIFSC